jgi:predicted  nucleic acid-binding Zn-ribbon protein
MEIILIFTPIIANIWSEYQNQQGDLNMARGVRKSSLEKLQKELADVQESIQQHKNSIAELIEKEKEIQEKISLEQFKEVSSILDQQKMSITDLKEFLISRTK